LGVRAAQKHPVNAVTLVAPSVALGALGLYVASADDAPGAAVIGMLLMAAAAVLGVRAARTRLPAWAAGSATVAGLAVAAVAALLIHGAVATAPLFPQSQDVPSVVGPPPPPYAGTVERARALVRAAVVAQNLPGVSVAVGSGRTLVWAEGFGWRDVVTRAPVTPTTRFNIGTAASALAAVAPLGLSDTGTDEAADWSPEHIGEPEEDFPLFTIVRHVVFRPIGLAPAQPLAGDRATFYVPRSDDHDPRRGRRLMYMRDLACCADGRVFYSTPSDLVRFALATNPDNVDGELAGGMVMSLMTVRDRDLSVAVTSNMAHANTRALAQRLLDAFAGAGR
jgi:CubicO group peptidase (beta-lactamase class C family)